MREAGDGRPETVRQNHQNRLPAAGRRRRGVSARRAGSSEDFREAPYLERGALRDSEFREYLGRRPLEFGQRRVADIADVFHALWRRIETAGGEIPETGEELRPRPQLGFRIRRVA